MSDALKDNHLYLHLTNITGIGATKLVESLLPCIERSQLANIVGILLPQKGSLSNYKPIGSQTIALKYKRFLPNSISRLLECLFFCESLVHGKPILVLGDIPLRYKGRQAVFVQTPHLLKRSISGNFSSKIKYLIARLLFSVNAKYVDLFIVQTDLMRDRLIETYPMVSGRVIVISQPPPSWVLNGSKNYGKEFQDGGFLKLIYPAANYPHKNHKLLAKISSHNDLDWPVEYLKITVDEKYKPDKSLKWIKCVGMLSESEVSKVYGDVDALVFLSLEESYGLPIIEAMHLGLPIVCPSLPYARVLCGSVAIYFDPMDIRSLNSAIIELKKRLEFGWRPNWASALNKIPKNWDEVAEKILLEINSSLR